MAKIQKKRQDLSVPSLALRPRSGAEMVHKTDETGNSFSQKNGHPKYHLHGRSVGWRFRSRSVSPSHLSHCDLAGIPRLCSQYKEIDPEPHSDPGRLFGIHSELSRSVPAPSPKENSKHSKLLQGPATTKTSLCESSSQSAKETRGNIKSSIPRSPSLQTITNGTDRGPTEKPKEIRSHDATERSLQTRNLLVDREFKRLEWQVVYNDCTSRSAADRDRRINRRMGSSMPRHLNPREMDKTRAKAPHKRRVVSSIICDKSLHKGGDKPRTSEDSQHHNNESNQQHGVNQVEGPVQTDSKSVAVLHGEKGYVDSRTSSRNIEYQSRQGIQDIQRFQQLETEETNLLSSHDSDGTSRHRSLCRSDESLSKQIHQLETGSHCDDNIRIHNKMGQIRGYAFPRNPALSTAAKSLLQGKLSCKDCFSEHHSSRHKFSACSGNPENIPDISVSQRHLRNVQAPGRTWSCTLVEFRPTISFACQV